MVIVTKQPPKGRFIHRPGLILAHAVTLTVFIKLCWSALAFEDASHALAFYGVFHRHAWNQVIHFVGVPIIVWSFLVFCAHLELPVGTYIQVPFIPQHAVNWGTLFLMVYLLFYLKMDPIGCLFYAPVLYTMYALSIQWVLADQQQQQGGGGWTGSGRLLQWALAANALSWYLQIHIGHLMIEESPPASGSDFGGAILSAPLFAFYEGVWALGLRSDFQQSILQLVDEYTQQVCQDGMTMRACAS